MAEKRTGKPATDATTGTKAAASMNRLFVAETVGIEIGIA